MLDTILERKLENRFRKFTEIELTPRLVYYIDKLQIVTAYLQKRRNSVNIVFLMIKFKRIFVLLNFMLKLDTKHCSVSINYFQVRHGLTAWTIA